MSAYAEIYRRLHPRPNPYCPYGKSSELRDLWPAEQQKFREMVDVIKDQPDEVREMRQMMGAALRARCYSLRSPSRKSVSAFGDAPRAVLCA